MLRTLFVYLLLSQLIACSGLNIKSSKQIKPTIKVEFLSPKRIHFQGKGAGAGMALMSSMGPVGIAIGVAIDEGIANDITLEADNKGLLINELVSNNLLNLASYSFVINKAQEKNEQLNVNWGARVSLIIKSYGFIIVDGNNDLTTAKWDIDVIKYDDNNNVMKVTEFHFPRDYQNPAAHMLTSFPLEQVKQDGTKAILLLNKGLKAIIKKPKFNQTLAD